MNKTYFEKLVQKANALDAMGRYAQANAITTELMRYAQTAAAPAATPAAQTATTSPAPAAAPATTPAQQSAPATAQQSAPATAQQSALDTWLTSQGSNRDQFVSQHLKPFMYNAVYQHLMQTMSRLPNGQQIVNEALNLIKI